MNAPKCETCGGEMAAVTVKGGKIYVKCGPCGTQTFIRSKAGIEKYVAKYGQPPGKGGAPAPTAKPRGRPTKAAPVAKTAAFNQEPKRESQAAPKAPDASKGVFELYDD